MKTFHFDWYSLKSSQMGLAFGFNLIPFDFVNGRNRFGATRDEKKEEEEMNA